MEASRSGASVVLIDPTGELGGNGAFSTGYMAFADTSMQRDRGISDSVELFEEDMRAEAELRFASHGMLTQPVFDLDLAHCFARDSGDAFEFLKSLGFGFSRFIPRPKQHSVDRLVALTTPNQFRTAFALQLEQAGVRTMLRHRALELVTKGGIVGSAIVANEKGEQSEIDINSAVIVTTGGYQASAEMRERYRPDQDPTASYKGLDTSRGDGQKMMESIGAELINMPVIPQQVQVASRFVEECIAVNEAGIRFEDEAGPYGERVKHFLEQPGEVGYYICDARSMERHPQLVAEMPLPPKRFDAVADIARAIDCSVEALTQTIEKWNAVVESGVDRDPEFGRVVFPDPRIGIKTPPFAVIRMAIGVSPTVGGARVTTSMEVKNSSGEVIPKVFAAGDCVGGVNAAAGLGGIHLASAVTLGRVAGRAAAG
jgi:succinate dehydrogenase/fumarate reductase flavoprotein subunit